MLKSSRVSVNIQQRKRVKFKFYQCDGTHLAVKAYKFYSEGVKIQQDKRYNCAG
jgi:hypothetical protein